MGARIGGKNFDITLGDTKIHCEAFTLDITDNTAVAQTRGVPNGHVDGDVAAAGEIEVDIVNFKLIKDQAATAGSFRELEPFDIVCYAKAGEDEIKYEAFGCKVRISSLLSLDPKGATKSTVKLPFDVTSPDFIKIDDVPYLAASEIEDLT
ncbi:DUF2597 family protein [Pseudomonas sp. CDFA 602]|uniref:phage protein n=1 Tax=Pseudomonas californiensis TaxID=2829823 RepID=UPI001E3B9415|nr:phage protein [Pseudomonas californiensis]MCD5993654.1 DUF2597 family protein [Pseudomonas californiensis]MCD5999249.1 DUF2597 family protein [Pseudomonas californiensis]